MTDPIVLHWHWERQLFVRAYLAMWRHGKGRRRREILTAAMGAALAAVILLARGSSPALTVVVAAIAAYGGWIGSLLGARVEAGFRARRFQRAHAQKYSDITVTADAAGLKIINADTRSERKWTAFDRIEETDGFVLLYTGPRGGVFVPKTHVDADALNRFLAMARAGIAAAGKGA